MPKQGHDLGVQKLKKATLALDRQKLLWSRAKRKHPGPLPEEFSDFKEWLNAGKPKWRKDVS